MPIIDEKRGVLVVRVVYDGPPFSGKTTSLRTLASGLGVEVTTPEEREGRTLFFDWIDYVGGLFEGRQIRCQIVSVPGQAEHAKRRTELLSSADAVVLVADTRRSELAPAFDVLRGLVSHCRAQDPPVGIVLQANKRDAPDAVPRDTLQAQLSEIAPLAIVETVATEGDGIREAFVFAVRLALDRVRACSDTGRLRTGAPDVNDAADLLERLKAIGAQPATQPPPRTNTLRAPGMFVSDASRDEITALTRRIRASSAPLEEDPVLSPNSRRANSEPVDEKPFAPDPLMPGGFIWPPVDGRVMLHEVATAQVKPVRTSKGDWWASCNGCLFHSAASAIYNDADTGRRALIDWARLHATHARRLSASRTVILADAGTQRFRLWQLVRGEPALRETLSSAIAESSALDTARVLIEAGTHLLRARMSLHCEELRLPCTLWTISGNMLAEPRFVGLMPDVGVDADEEASGAELLTRELAPIVRNLAQQSSEFPLLAEAWHAQRERNRDNLAAEALSQIALAYTQRAEAARL